MVKNKITISILLITIGVACRLLPHTWNFTPIIAIALFSGVYLGWKYAFVLPIVTMLLSDIFLGFYEWPLMIAVYASYMLVGLLSLLVKKYKSGEMIITGTLLGSIIFFAVTNYAVWQFSPWYAKNVSGLIECYTLALPFFRSSLLGNLFYVSIFFGALESIKYFVKKEKEAAQTKAFIG